MSDTIEEKATKITEKIYAAFGTDSGVLFGITDMGIVKAIIEFTLNRTIINLCDTCTQSFATCHRPDNCKFECGDGIGNDNIIECDGYVKKEEP